MRDLCAIVVTSPVGIFYCACAAILVIHFDGLFLVVVTQNIVCFLSVYLTQPLNQWQLVRCVTLLSFLAFIPCHCTLSVCVCVCV